MNPGEYARMHALEDWYWWFVARRQAAVRFLLDFAPAERPLRVLDAGCGTGGLLDLFQGMAGVEAVGADLSPDALRLSHGRGHHRLVGADLTLLPFRTSSFDAVTALDVIEHVPDEERALGEISRVLRPGGVLVASVPAYQFLWGPHDDALHHQRRYTAPQFCGRIQGSGLVVEKQTYLLTALFPLAAAARLTARRKEDSSAGLPMVPRPLNRALIALQAAELAVARRASLPFGLSVVVVARKPVPARVKLRSVEERIPVPAAR